MGDHGEMKDEPAKRDPLGNHPLDPEELKKLEEQWAQPEYEAPDKQKAKKLKGGTEQ